MKVKVAAFTILLSTTLSASALEVGDTPWLTWAEGSYAWSDSGSEEGLKLDAFFKQGYVVSTFGNGWAVVPYAALRGTVSENRDEPWNNKAGPWIGIEVRKPADLGNGKWSDVAVGIRGEYYEYFGSGRDGEVRGLIYVSFGAGGSKW